jgi:hypothetical protein
MIWTRSHFIFGRWSVTLGLWWFTGIYRWDWCQLFSFNTSNIYCNIQAAKSGTHLSTPCQKPVETATWPRGPCELISIDQPRLTLLKMPKDTLLLPPPKLADPCLNLLHFPPGIRQTAHTHPSVRCTWAGRKTYGRMRIHVHFFE